MKKTILILLSLLIMVSCKDKTVSEANLSNQKMNLSLKEKLEHILVMDQGIRQLLQENLSEKEKNELLKKMNLPRESIENDIYALMTEIDSTNLAEVEKIISEYGYPGVELVGKPANETVFYVIQHSDKIEQYLPLIRNAAKNGDVSMKSLAKMEDRHLMHRGKEQIYGTQIRGQKNKNGEWVHFVWPIKNPDSINIVRNSIGLGSIEDYAKQFDIEYKVLTLEEINEL